MKNQNGKNDNDKNNKNTTQEENNMNTHKTDEEIFNRIYSLTLDRDLKELKKLQSEIGKDRFNEITRRLTYNDEMIAESLKWVTNHWTESPEEKIAKFEAMDAEFKTPKTLEEAIQIAERFTEWENLKGLKILKDTVGEEMWSGVMEEIKANAWLYVDELKHLSEYWSQIDHTKENTMTDHSQNQNQNPTQEETEMETLNDPYESKYSVKCTPDPIFARPYIEEMVEDFFERGYDEIDDRVRYMIDHADAGSMRFFVRELGLGYPVEMFANERTKDAKYIQDHARCGEECIVPLSKRIALANADDTSNHEENIMNTKNTEEGYSFEWDDEIYEFESKVNGEFIHLFFQRDFDGIDKMLSEMIINEEYEKLSELCDFRDIGGKQLFDLYVKDQEAKDLREEAIPMIDALIPEVDLSFL